MIKIILLFVVLSIVFISPISAEDTELYINNIADKNARPKVLIIFDTSGSMGGIITDKDAYDTSITYPSPYNFERDRLYMLGRYIYEKPENFWIGASFLASSNRCAESIDPLNENGRYLGFFRTWVDPANKTDFAWHPLGTRETESGVNYSTVRIDITDLEYIDCIGDIEANNPGNPGSPSIADGYPSTTGQYSSTSDSHPFIKNPLDIPIAFLTKERWWLYSGNYLNYLYNDGKAFGLVTKLDIAKRVVKEIISEHPGVDFGLQIFNATIVNEIGVNTTPDVQGGRIISKISDDMTPAQQEDLKVQVDSFVPLGMTPLCETSYEAYRYFTGLSVMWGNAAPADLPPRDTTAENEGSYISPLGECEEAYVILMTDGIATYDSAANTLIDDLPGIAKSSNRLANLAGWLYNNDIDFDESNGTQRVVTYTIGYHLSDNFLKEVAYQGGGIYHPTFSADGLKTAFSKTLNEILKRSTSFSAPTVAVNTFSKTQSYDSTYMALFKPDNRPRWTGNLKKLTINDDGIIVNDSGVQAIDPLTGEIKRNIRTIWSSEIDGGEVEAGGAGGKLIARSLSSRKILTNTGNFGELEDFDKNNTQLHRSLFNTTSDTERNELIDWATGIDVDDEDSDGDKTDTRPWILGDPLHSRPLAITYGGNSDNPSIRILMGTNHGVLHMFSNDNGQESWAFMPKELLSLTKVLRENNSSLKHPYGIDGSPVAYVVNENGDIDSATDSVYVYFGLRRGGSGYYALDVTDPDDPQFMWYLDNNTPGFSELGQSWSTPVITHIPGVSDPVMIIGAGYDNVTNKDNKAIGTDDNKGRGIFIVNAVSGELIWSVTPGISTANNLQETMLLDSIPASITTLDSNGDHLVDRLYFGDTGGNVWRVDMPGNSLPNASQNTWSIYKLAELGGSLADNDRRFFNQIDVVSTRDGTLAFDGILLGSGNRSHPNGVTVINSFFMIRDTNIKSQYFSTLNKPTTINHASLYNATPNDLQNNDESLSSLLAKPGWRIELTREGEKSLSPSVTLNGTVYFTTFAPNNALQCTPIPGNGYLYGVNLQRATAVRNWTDVTTSDPTFTTADRQTSMGSRLPDSVTPHFRKDKIRLIGIGTAGVDGSGSIDTDGSLQIKGSYWYQEGK